MHDIWDNGMVNPALDIFQLYHFASIYCNEVCDDVRKDNDSCAGGIFGKTALESTSRDCQQYKLDLIRPAEAKHWLVPFKLNLSEVQYSNTFPIESIYSFIMRYLFAGVRIQPRGLNNLVFSRTHHSATGRFITISPEGTPVAREIEVWLGDPGNAYVMFDPQISLAFQKETFLQGCCSLAQDQELYPLKFFHDTRHFSYKSSSYPRLEIPQDLPRQSNAKTSIATLHAYGVTHAITLYGTPDADFQHSIRESIKRLQPVLDKLQDM